MLIVQHMPVGFTQMYADRLNRLCQMEVREARHGYRGSSCLRNSMPLMPGISTSEVMTSGLSWATLAMALMISHSENLGKNNPYKTVAPSTFQKK